MQKGKKTELLKIILPYLLVAGFVLFKVRDLFLPYFWDEAWSYIPAIRKMASVGPSLMPNAISPELYRGHPLLFYFLSSLWIKVFGSNIWVTKLFSLLTSIGLLLSVYSFSKKNFDYFTAIFTLILLMIQSVFFAQSTFLLPEILLALFTVLSLQSYLDKKRFLTILWLTLALYTKESAIIIWTTILFFELIETIKIKNKSYILRFINLLYFTLPLILITVFFIAQKIIVGWYFFPEHISHFSFGAFFDRLNGYLSYLFIFIGRNMLTIFGLVALVLLIIRKESILIEKKKVLLILSFYIISYLLFSSLNFYSPRYLLSIMPFTVLIWVYFIKSTIKYHVAFPVLLLVIVILNNLHFTINKRSGHDHTLGYRDLIHVQTKMISYCENEGIYNREIYTRFLMLHNLTNKDLGYLNKDSIFFNVRNNLTSKTEFAIVCSNELNKFFYDNLRKKGVLIKRYEKNGCWTELYQMRNN